MMTRSSAHPGRDPHHQYSKRRSSPRNTRSRTPQHHHHNTTHHQSSDSCYSIESLNSTQYSDYTPDDDDHTSCPRPNWKTSLCVFLLALTFAFIVMYTSSQADDDDISIDFANGSTAIIQETTQQERAQPPASPPVVQFDYNTEPESEDSGKDPSPNLPQISEYIHLYKLPPPLDNDDYYYQQQNNNNNENLKKPHHRFNKHGDNSRHHYFNTGVFRPPKSRLWDPHPQYIFHAFNKRFHLVLNQISKKHSFLMPGFKVTTHRGSSDRRGETWVSRETISAPVPGEEQTFEGCFYNGYVLGDLDSSVAVSLCSGMTGHIRTSTGSYFIEPRYKNSQEHEIYQIASQRHDDPVPPPAEIPPKQQHSSDNSTSSSRSSSSSSSSNLKITPYDYYSDEDYDSEEEDQQDSSSRQRSKRSLSTERYVELTVVTDQTMSRYHGENLKHYVLTLLSIVALVYRDASIGNPVNIVLVNFHVLTDTDFSGTTNSTTSLHGTSASEMLRNFCKWQKEHNHPDDRHALHHDTALLLTRETICRNPWVGKCDTLGLAELGTMCDHYASCAIVQDNGLSAAFTIAHELGHVLNMPHDDDYKCQSFVERTRTSAANDVDDSEDNPDNDDGGDDPSRVAGGRSTSSSSSSTPTSLTSLVEKNQIQHYVMSRMLDHNTYPWAWSRCSRHFLTEFLDAGHGYCLEDKPDSNLLYNDDENSVDDESSHSSVQQPGEIFSEHKQCELVFGPNSQLCSYMPPCRRLWCTNHGGPESEESEGCRTQHMPWADGTRCGANKWCQRGQCVLKDLEKLKVINGGWGSWQEYGECSRSCGGGVKKSYRECDNPKPRNGGKYCVGPRVRYESCSTFDCANTTVSYDFRASQCAAFNGDNFNIHGLPDDVLWVPKYNGISPKDRCKLFCRVQGSSSYYLLKEKVIDGTPCGIDTFDVCVNGACLPAGCDRRLHSSKTLDICGVCGGDGSTCTTSQGSYNSTKYGYNGVIRIPSGASNIDIRQRSYDNTARDDNYLALLDPITNEYVLNGHFVVSMFRKTIHYGGSVLEYSGSDQIVERINSSSRPIKRDLDVRVLSVGKLKPPDIVFQYVISSDNRSSTVVVTQTASSRSSSSNDDVAEYEWVGRRESDRTPCSSACQGNTLPPSSYDCVRKSAEQSVVVQSTHCTSIPKPAHSRQPCNTHCTIKYVTSCPESCVHARNNYTVDCVRVLHSTNTSQKISDNYCIKSSVQKPPPPDCLTECRNKKPKWRYTQWSECSVNSAPLSLRCGANANNNNNNASNSVGVQIRNVWCQRFNWRSLIDPAVDNFEVADDRECEGDKPAGRRTCRSTQTASSAICGEWKIDQWSPCSTSCGPGITRALYACMLTTHAQTQLLPPDYCVHSRKPIVERPCEQVPCARYASTNWSECNCETKTETREVTCMVNNSPSQDTTICERLITSVEKPELERSCPDPHVCHDYVVGDWSVDCRLYNGKSYRYRAVNCEHGNCAGTVPESKLECGEWKIESNWSGCNGSCSVGVEVRAVGCWVNSVKVEDRHCEGVMGEKPASERKCYHNCAGGGVGKPPSVTPSVIHSLRMGGRGEEGYGGGVNVPTSSNPGVSSRAETPNNPLYNFYNTVHGGGRGEQPGSTVPPLVYKWQTGSWGKCTRMTSRSTSSSSCPPSSSEWAFRKHRQVKCVAEPTSPQPTSPPRRLTTVPSSYCAQTAYLPPSDSANCSSAELAGVSPCPTWLTSEWTACTIKPNTDQNCEVNTTILHGVKSREVSCVQDNNNSTLGDEHCVLSSVKPEVEENCVVKASSSMYSKSYCTSVAFKWRTGNWSQCILEGGTSSSRGTTNGSPKKCGGKGKKNRDVMCVRAWKGVETVVDDIYCVSRRGNNNKKAAADRRRGGGASKSDRPRVTRDCVRTCKEGRAAPLPFKWVTGDWTECSRPCGGYGLSSRRVACHRSNTFDWLDPEPLPAMIPSQNTTNYCPPPKPKEYDYCIVSETCEKSEQQSSPENTTSGGNTIGKPYNWTTSEWSKCSCTNNDTIVSSVSFQKRKVYCVTTSTGQKTPAKHCSSLAKPQRKQKCECNVFRTCEEMRAALISKLIPVKDGEYSLHVGGKVGVKIYCHGMTDLGNPPKEYVSVNEDNNYSEIYDKRLIRPETCPRNGTRMASCECVNDRNRRVGVTRWRRVRVNVTNLRVDNDDFTFAYSSQDLIPYGTAGDCYSSSMICPQGRFAIDLRSTGFAVSSLTSWSTTGHRATMRVVRKNFGPYWVGGGGGAAAPTVSQFIQGKCGGYCGTCAVAKGIGLRLDVV